MEGLRGYKRPEIPSPTQSRSDENAGIFSCLPISDNSDCGKFRASQV